jgi:cell division septal protein FtsQ
MKVIVIAVVMVLAVLGGGAYLLYYADSLEPPQRPVSKVLPDEQFPQPK